MSEISFPAEPQDNSRAAEKVRDFPATPGVYLMKDAAGRVIYVGKAKNLRAARAATSSRRRPKTPARPSWCRKSATSTTSGRERGRRPADGSPADQGHPAEVQPRPPRRQDLSLPGDPHPRGFSPRGVHPQAAATAARSSTGRSPTPAACGAHSGACRRSSSSAPARWTSTRTTRAGGGSGPACWPRSANARPPATCGSRRRTTARASTACSSSWKARRRRLLGEMREEMEAAAEAAAVRGGGPAPRRDPPAGNARPARRTRHARAARGLSGRSQEGAGRPAKGAAPGRRRRGPIEGIDIAHTAGTETVASVVQFIDGLPFKPGYRRMRIRTVAGRRRFRQHPRGRFAALPATGRRTAESDACPTSCLIDGGKGQLHAALQCAWTRWACGRRRSFRWPSARKRFTWPAATSRLRLSRHSYALRLLQYVRDEAHRFAQHYHHLLRKRSTLGEE